MPKYPQPSDYQAAIQNPHLVFRQPELQACRVRVDRLGMPVVSSGGFALSFYLQAPAGEQWVVRCFKADSPDRRARYDAISRFLNAHPDPLLLDVDYYDQGILVNGVWYPVVKMPLVRGVTLQRYIEHELAQGRSVAHLSRKFRAAARRLEQLGIAHGDLQHGNIMVQHGELVLVDYDGMYVPELRNWPPAEIGSAAYQHPLRKDQFGPNLDRFSAIVIDVALQALAVKPDLWAKYNTGENLLFRRTDFLEPHASALLRELEQIPQLRVPVRNLHAICQAPFEATPRLEEVVPPLAAPAFVVSAAQGALRVREAEDIDEKLNKLYAAVPPAPANAAPPVAAAPPAQAARVQGSTKSPQDENWEEVGRVLRMLPKALRVVWFTVIFSLTFGRTIFSGVADLVTADPIAIATPAARPTIVRQVDASDLGAQAAADVCPDDVYVNLQEPRDYVIDGVLHFVWRANKSVIPPCRYWIKVWREDGLTKIIKTNDSLKWDGAIYTMEVFLHLTMPPEEQKGTFYWTLELGVEGSSSDPIPTHGAPLKFDWDPL